MSGKPPREHPPGAHPPFPDRPPTRLALLFWRMARWLEKRNSGTTTEAFSDKLKDKK